MEDCWTIFIEKELVNLSIDRLRCIIICNDEQPRTSTGNAVACPIAIPFSTYATGREATMMEAQLWPLLTKEQDILAQSLSPTAPTTGSISIGAQQ